MRASFIELPAFERHRSTYLDDDQFRRVQLDLLEDPERGDLITGTGGLRKMRFGDARRGKGKRGGLRVIYYWWNRGNQFWLFAVYAKDELEDLSPADKRVLRRLLDAELQARL
jgi:hypothetical protein